MIDAALASKTKNKWKLFCHDNPKIFTLPTDPFFTGVYFNHLLVCDCFRGYINDTYYGIRWGHHSIGYTSATEHSFVDLAFEGSKRLSNSSSKPARYRAGQFIQVTLFFLALCLLGFAGFMRISELLEVKKRRNIF